MLNVFRCLFVGLGVEFLFWLFETIFNVVFYENKKDRMLFEVEER